MVQITHRKITHRKEHELAADCYAVLLYFMENGAEAFASKYEKTGPDDALKTNLEKYLKKTDSPKDNPQIPYLKYLAAENKKIADGIKPDTALGPFDYNMQRLQGLAKPAQPPSDLKIRNIAYAITHAAHLNPHLLDDYKKPNSVRKNTAQYA